MDGDLLEQMRQYAGSINQAAAAMIRLSETITELNPQFVDSAELMCKQLRETDVQLWEWVDAIESGEI